MRRLVLTCVAAAAVLPPDIEDERRSAMKTNSRYVIAITIAGLALTLGVAVTAAQWPGDRGYRGFPNNAASVGSEAPISPMPPCSLATVVGDWGVRFSGKTPDGAEITGINTFHLDKYGTATMHAWTNVGGGVFFESSGTGTITVNADCTGTLVEEGEGASPPSKFVILRRGLEVWGVYDAPLFVTYIGKRIDRVQ